jgi:thiol reductant ABC exporter CydC subunit
VSRRAATRWIRAFARPARGRFALAAMTGSAALGSAVGLAATAAWLIARAAQHPPVLYLLMATAAVRAFGVGRGVLRYAERLISHDAAFRVLREVRVAVWQRLDHLGPAGVPAFRSGDLLARLVTDVDALQDLYLRVLLPYAAAAVGGAATVALLWWLLPLAGLALLAAMLVAAVVAPWLTARANRRAARSVAPLRGEQSAATAELFGGAADLIAYGAAPARLAALASVDGDLLRAQASTARRTGLGGGLAMLAAGSAVWAALALAAPALRARTLPAVALVVVVLTPLAAFEIVTALPAAADHVERVRRSAGRVADVLEASAVTPVGVAHTARPEPPLTVRVEGLRVCWPGTTSPALDGIDLELRPGQRIAVVGTSGSGKTTLIWALLRFLAPAGGRISVNGVDLAALAEADVRRLVTCFGQDAHLFDTTIEENIRLADRHASAAQMRSALADARLLDWVDSLPGGLSTRVGGHGDRVSGGQRQRIALARVRLAGAPVVLLDEPVEHLDLATAEALTADLLATAEERSTLLVTHRLAGLAAADEIVVLHAGRIVQRGHHDQLVAADGPYRAMWRREHPQGWLSST